MISLKKPLAIVSTLASILLSTTAIAECPDYQAKMAADELSKAFLGKNSEVFQAAVVLKRHHPSHQKEVASYIKTGERYYTMYSIVNGSCKALFIKRTGPRS